MSSPFDVSGLLSRFEGEAPLFPLPNVVHFPHILLPLHIFESRYRRMVADALANERWIAMALLRPDAGKAAPWELPAIHEMVCLGRIRQEQRLPDGRYYLILEGVSRARVLEEIPSLDRPYRVGRLSLENDVYPPAPECGSATRWKELLKEFRKLFPNVDLSELIPGDCSSSAPLGVLCDILAFAMKLDVSLLQELLAEKNVATRCDRLRGLLAQRQSSQNSPAQPGRFPPPFSLN